MEDCVTFPKREDGRSMTTLKAGKLENYQIDDDVEGWETRELSIYSNNSSQYSIPGPVSHF